MLPLVSSLALMLCSCSFTHLPQEVHRNIEEADEGINNANEQIHHAQSVQNNNFISHKDNIYFGSNLTTIKNANLPSVFNSSIQIDRTFYNLNQFAEAITKLTGLPVLVQGDPDKIRQIRVTQAYGSLVDLLEDITTKADVSWIYKDGKILIAETETRTWTIKNIPGNLQLQNQINNTAGISGSGGEAGSASSGGQGGSGQASSTSSSSSNQQTVQNVQFNYNGDYWKALDNALRSMVSKVGSYSINDQTTSVTVNDKPSVLEKIGAYIERQNALMSRRVNIDVQILSVDTDASDNYGINWNLILKGSGATFAMNGQTAQTSADGKTSFVPSPVYMPSDTTQAFTVSSTGGSLSGSQLIIDALSRMSKVSNRIDASAVTVSNQPVPINLTDQVNYLASVTTTVTGGASGGATQTALTPGQLSVGFSMNILPVIEDDGMVRLQASISLSNLKAMDKFSSGGSSIQLPSVGNRSFMQKTAIRSGDTFVMTGFDAGVSSINQNGVGGVSNWWLGGGVNAKKTRQKLVILITPRVISS